jgi:two-component system chemotaxis sensor kinase CheA
LSKALSTCGEIISTQPGITTSQPQQIAFRIIYATDNTAAQLTTMLAHVGPIELRELVARTAKEEKATVGDADSVSGPESAIPLTMTPLTTSMRIELSELDEVIIATHALFKETMDALDRASPLDLPAEDGPTEVKIRAERIRRGFEELERILFELRTVPVARTLARAIRAGAAAARATGKEVDFEIEGGETRLDKALSDTIADPLLHLLRNAVDHGIESPSERASLGKNVRGLIKLETLVEVGQVLLRVIDNGRGIDPKHVARAAVDRGMIQGNTEVSREESLRIIFFPGFSTAETVSNVSGRGVGLDIVSRAVEQVGGKIQVHSEVGVGTTFELTIPIEKKIDPDSSLLI